MRKTCSFNYLPKLLLLALAICSLQGCSAPSEPVPAKPNVVVLLLDTLRASHVSHYGYERKTTPALDAFAEENISFSYATTPAPWTPPAVASLFTGLYPGSHGLMPPNSREQAQKEASRLAGAAQTLAETLQAQGYATAAVSPNPWIAKEFGFDQGFEDFRYRSRARCAQINQEAFSLLKGFSQKKPFFLYLHYLDPHDPYDAPAPYGSMYSGELSRAAYSPDMLDRINRYDGEIRYLDSCLEQLFAKLKAQPYYKDLVLVIAGDHGEQFMERGNKTHGYQLFNEEVHVPLILKAGRVADSPRKVAATVSLIDVFPTLLELTGLKANPDLQGVSLLNQQALEQRPGVVSEIFRKYHQKSLVTADGLKLIVGSAEMRLDLPAEDPATQALAIFDIRKDYLEQHKITAPPQLLEMQQAFRQIFARSSEMRLDASDAGTATVSQETLDQLESLGYLK